eukprot:TRINITY_DN6314_c0_g1_i2.p3 TRINITY_DN6314_c0_g1~~TRINITY_DN6314_c0_g1_i2.p3  ORF type:complete len:124 (-),score=4.09 TRINITY_DN6314_c0_g1_i2:723-1094(-)
MVTLCSGLVAGFNMSTFTTGCARHTAFAPFNSHRGSKRTATVSGEVNSITSYGPWKRGANTQSPSFRLILIPFPSTYALCRRFHFSNSTHTLSRPHFLPNIIANGENPVVLCTVLLYAYTANG